MTLSDIIFLIPGALVVVAYIAFKPARHTKDDSYSHPDTLAWIAKQWDVK